MPFYAAYFKGNGSNRILTEFTGKLDKNRIRYVPG